jgi:hypothetical protein
MSWSETGVASEVRVLEAGCFNYDHNAGSVKLDPHQGVYMTDKMDTTKDMRAVVFSLSSFVAVR